MSRRNASDQGYLNPPIGQVVRFTRDLAALIDVDSASVLVAVSGGADSVALLLLMKAAIGDRCHAATVDHGLRAAAADEARFVAALCRERGIAHHILSGALPPRVGRTANVSARARVLRYQLLERHAEAVGATWLATAHHADDQVETLVMRLNRGAGVAGLAGIRHIGGRIIRPLLGWRSADLAALVVDCGITPVTDPSNIDDRYDRARLRKVLVDIDWLDTDRIVHSATALGEAEDALAWMTRRLWTEAVVESADGLVLDPGAVPHEIRRRLVILCLERIDPARSPAGPAVSRLLSTLAAGRSATLGEVKVTVVNPRKSGLRWTFAKAPPRRSH